MTYRKQAASTAMIICKRVHYSGRVQGVGFRYTAQSLAQGFPIAGYVRNLSTGQVELAAEGTPEDVETFLAALTKQMAWYIHDQDVQEITPQGFKSFQIRT